MTAREYVIARMKFSKTMRSPEEFDLIALGMLTGQQGFRIANAKELTGLPYEEIRSSIETLKDRGILNQLGANITLTIRGEQEAEKYFPVVPANKYFMNALRWVEKLVDSENSNDFREANRFAARVREEVGHD